MVWPTLLQRGHHHRPVQVSPQLRIGEMMISLQTLQLEIPQEVCRREDGHLWADVAGGGRGPEIPGDVLSLSSYYTAFVNVET